MMFFVLLLLVSCSSNAKSVPLIAPLTQAIIPFPEDPVPWATAADLLNQGLLDSSGLSSGAGFILTDDNRTIVDTSDCNISTCGTTQFTLYKSSSKQRVPVQVKVACEDLSLSNFPNTHYGIAALSASKSALPRQITTAAGLPSKFAYCLPNQGGNGSIFFGATSYPYKGINLIKTPMKITSSNSYTVQLTEVRVGNVELAVRKLSVTISSVAENSVLPTGIYNLLFSRVHKNLLERGIVEAFAQTRPPLYPSNHCYFMNITAVAASPKIELTHTLVLDPESYFFKLHSFYCFGFLEGSPVIGTRLQEGRLMEFDLNKNTLGFSGLLANHGSTCAVRC